MFINLIFGFALLGLALALAVAVLAVCAYLAGCLSSRRPGRL